jgi:hypothetical protein
MQRSLPLVDLIIMIIIIGGRLGMALKASNVVGNPVALHQIW